MSSITRAQAWPRRDVAQRSVRVGEEVAVGELDDRQRRTGRHSAPWLDVGTRSCSAPGSTSNRAGVVPGCSPSSSTGTGSAVSTRDDTAAEGLGLRVRQVRAAVDLRHRQHEVALGHVADRDDVEETVVGQRRRGTSSSRRRRSVRSRRRRRTSARCVVSSSTVSSRLDGRPAREHGERRPEVRRLRAERLRRVVRALGDRPAHAGARDVGEARRSPRFRPTRGR